MSELVFPIYDADGYCSPTKGELLKGDVNLANLIEHRTLTEQTGPLVLRTNVEALHPGLQHLVEQGSIQQQRRSQVPLYFILPEIDIVTDHTDVLSPILMTVIQRRPAVSPLSCRNGHDQIKVAKIEFDGFGLIATDRPHSAALPAAYDTTEGLFMMSGTFDPSGQETGSLTITD